MTPIDELFAINSIEPTEQPHVEQAPVPIEQPSVSQPNQFTDVHQFDYSYRDQSYQVNIDHNVLEMTDAEKHQWIIQLRHRLHNGLSVQGLDLILANIGMPANNDTTNQKRAEDILVMLTKYIIQCDESLLPLVEEQLQDMLQLGQCAQGRTTRLWQLYCSLPKNESTEAFLKE